MVWIIHILSSSTWKREIIMPKTLNLQRESEKPNHSRVGGTLTHFGFFDFFFLLLLPCIHPSTHSILSIPSRIPIVHPHSHTDTHSIISLQRRHIQFETLIQAALCSTTASFRLQHPSDHKCLLRTRPSSCLPSLQVMTPDQRHSHHRTHP